ncbi:MAG TPA: hypothetical protein VF777_12645 [Phycisphaerales bacterium]
MKIACASLAVVIASSFASAGWGLKFEVSSDGGGTWTHAVNALPGQTVAFRIGAYFDVGTKITTADGTGNAAATNRFTGSNEVTNLGAGDSLQNVVRTASSGSTTIVQISGGTIGTTSITSFAGQLIIGPLPDPPQTYFQLITGELKVVNGAARVMTLKNKTFGSGATKGLTFYHDGSPSNKQSAQPETARTDQEATINVIPGPGGLALLGVACVMARRQRYTCFTTSPTA